jgi:hypothetical protein
MSRGTAWSKCGWADREERPMKLFLAIAAGVPGGASEGGITSKDEGTILTEYR